MKLTSQNAFNALTPVISVLIGALIAGYFSTVAARLQVQSITKANNQTTAQLARQHASSYFAAYQDFVGMFAGEEAVIPKSKKISQYLQLSREGAALTPYLDMPLTIEVTSLSTAFDHMVHAKDAAEFDKYKAIADCRWGNFVIGFFSKMDDYDTAALTENESENDSHSGDMEDCDKIGK
ncbi:hypothetical protein [Pseudomonas allokribbensis]|uniref:hypothetical protein n=1 Tax=Pseudomonas allokribbensis TaxID=2774460 RepID=UPI0017886F55|nr:hypothetical protein [Pseudomonas allokribbensis]